MKRNSILIRFLLLIWFVFLIMIIPSCKKDITYEDLDQVSYTSMLSCSDTSYIVICWQVECSNCEKLKETMVEYYNYQKKHKDAPKLYGLNVNLSYNKDIINTTEDPYIDMIGTTDYKDITVRTTPTILYIEHGALIKNISDYSTKWPVTEGKAFLQSFMN